MQRKFLPQAILATIALGVSAGSVHAADWLQFGYDQAHTSNNIEEKGYSTLNGNLLLFHYTLSSAADSAPVYLSNVSVTKNSVTTIKNLLFILSKNGTLLALDADAPTSAASLVWSAKPAGSATLSTGAPAIDPNLQFVYAYGNDGKVHKYAVGDGTETVTTCALNSNDCWPQLSSLKADVEKNAAGLSIASPSGGPDYLYSVTDGYIGDGGDYQGHITAINLSTGSQKVFNSECSALTIHFIKSGTTSGTGQNDCASKQNGIWGRAGAIFDADTNRIFITTGNGPFDANTATGQNWGDSILALNVDGTGSGSGKPVDSYTPATFQQLQNTDADLGSVSIAVIAAPPGTAAQYQHLGVQPGKDGCVRLINLADMSGNAAPGHTGGEIQAVDFPGTSNCMSGNDAGGGNEIKPQPATWVNPVDLSSWVYVVNTGGSIVGYKITLNGSGKPSLTQQWTSTAGTSPIVANGSVYYLAGGRLRALDATTGTSLVSTTSTWGTTALGSIHWQSPIIANGRLYVVDSSQLWAFALDGIFKTGDE